MNKLEVFLILVLEPSGKWSRRGPVYWRRATAKGWLSFVRGATRCHAKIKRVVLPIASPGKTTPEAARMMSEKYLVDVAS